jgi:hypothetical protein
VWCACWRGGGEGEGVMRVQCRVDEVVRSPVTYQATCCCLLFLTMQEEWAAPGLQGLSVPQGDQGLHDPRGRLPQGRR